MLGSTVLPLAEIIDAGTLAIMIPIIALMIPIVALFQSHQQKMAEIIHGGKHRQIVEGELDAMRAEIGQLKSNLATQALALEGLANRKQISGPSETDSLAQRLG